MTAELSESSNDTATDEMLAAWGDLLSSMEGFAQWAAAGEHAVDRAEGLRHGLRYLGHLAEYLIEHNDPCRPEVTLANSPVRTLYGNSADCSYYMSRISPKREYRVWGQRGDAPLVSAQVHRYSGDTRVAGTFVVTDEVCDEDGNYEFYLSSDLRGRLGLTLDEGCGEVYFRHYSYRPGSETAPTFFVELLGEPAPPRPALDEATLARRIRLVAKGMRLVQPSLTSLVDALRKRPNQIVAAWDPEDPAFDFFYGATTQTYLGGWWDLRGTNGLEVTFRPPPAAFVSIQIFNRWFEAMEYRDHVTNLNAAQMRPNEDGSFTVRIGGDPQPVNWLDAFEHEEGIVMIRYILRRDEPGSGTPPAEVRVLR
ncbi:DUF1214 domain-containing protein [Amycolatopsis rubida]|uniref:DUF1214 domain-containing protein n=1 Tax=Amycolatopsis rubida TaxID=112413 RepID=A0A1I5ZH49_9PSEU|nr:DUF1214 domain-containing protein [Amycolatopsis rubida]SFQ55740.1 Protein of unknown function [Amycolatopsis rubida]